MNMNIMNIILYDYLSRRGINSIISLSLSLLKIKRYDTFIREEKLQLREDANTK